MESHSPEIGCHCITQKAGGGRPGGIRSRPFDDFLKKISYRVSLSWYSDRDWDSLPIVDNTSTQEGVDQALDDSIVFVNTWNLAAEVVYQACDGLNRGWNLVVIGMAVQ